jgi:hypothetical protein
MASIVAAGPIRWAVSIPTRPPAAKYPSSDVTGTSGSRKVGTALCLPDRTPGVRHLVFDTATRYDPGYAEHEVSDTK